MSHKFAAFLLIFLLHLFEPNNSQRINDGKDDYERMLLVKANIENSTSPFCHGSHSNTVKAFIHGKWKMYFGGNSNALVYPFCLKTNELGNRLGNYFNEIACAEIIGVNFIAIHRQFDIGPITTYNSSQISPLAFLDSLPDYILHKSPVNFDIARSLAKEHCQCTQYCWQDKKAPWIKALPTIKSIMINSIQNYFNALNRKSESLGKTDIANINRHESIPIIPDVAIQYRCGDNIGFNYRYGIIPFFVMKSRIPIDARYIYVLTDDPKRSIHSNGPKCELIIQSLYHYLVNNFPQTKVVVKRGGDMFLDYVRLANAQVTICSASTFCLWPAIANNGIVHFPMTSLIAGVDNPDLIVNLTESFRWITEAEIISSFHKIKPWQKIIDILIGNATQNENGSILEKSINVR